MKRKFIGHIITIPQFVKKEYLSKKKKHPMMVDIEILSDDKYGAIAKLYERNSLFDRFQETTTIKQRKRFSEAFSEAGKNNKPLDTSKWVKPDEKTIRNALIESLFALEILKEDSPNYREYYGKAKAFYSILHGHSPSNPQTLSNWNIDPYFSHILDELKCPVSKKYWANFNKDFNKDKKKDYKKWVKICLKNMIIPDPSPPKFKNIFKEAIKKTKSKFEKLKAKSL